MAIDVTFPTIDFPHRGELERSAFVAAQETAQDTLADEFTTAIENFQTQANALEINVNNKEANVVAKHDIVVAKEALMSPHYANIDICAENIGDIGEKLNKSTYDTHISVPASYHLLQGNLDLSLINANYTETSTTTTRNYTISDYIFDTTNLKLYDCILSSTSGTLLTNTTYFTKITDAGTLQINNALIPLAKGVDSNGIKNEIVVANETITCITLTAGKNYVYSKNDGTYGVKNIAPNYGKTNPTNGGDFYDILENKWYTSAGTEITESRNYLDAIVYADNDGSPLYVEELPKVEYKDTMQVNELNVLSKFNLNQTWQSMINQRVAGATYWNTTGKPITISITVYFGAATNRYGVQLLVDGTQSVAQTGYIGAASDHYLSCSIPVPDGSSYGALIINNGNITKWQELR